MYPEKVPYWQRGQLITAERLNKAVRMLNWLLDIAADNDSDQQDDGESGGDVKVLPPGGSIPPKPYYDNPPVEIVDAAGQPFLKLGELNVETVPPPVFALKPAMPGEVPGTPYYTNVTTDVVGNVESVEVSESPGTFRLWDGAEKGSLSVCSGALIKDEFGEFHTFDSNPFFLPVLPVSLLPSSGSASSGSPATFHSLVDKAVGNSVPIKPLVAGAGVVITEEVLAGEIPIRCLVISAGTTSASWLDTITEPEITDGVLYLNMASDNVPGGVKSIYISKDATEPKLDAGNIVLPLSFFKASNPSFPNPVPGLVSKVSYNATISDPAISAGEIEINPASQNVPGYLDSVAYDLTSTSPDIQNGRVIINGAYFDPSNPSHETPMPGAIASVSLSYFDASGPSFADFPPPATIHNGDIRIRMPKPAAPPSFEVQNVTDSYGSSAAPGSDGWVQTMYIEGSYQSGSLQFQRYDRQLMRFSGAALQVVNQKMFPSSSASGWVPA